MVAPYGNGRIGNWYPNRAAVMGENVPAILVASGAAALGWSGVLCNCSDLGGAGWLPDLCGWAIRQWHTTPEPSANNWKVVLLAMPNTHRVYQKAPAGETNPAGAKTSPSAKPRELLTYWELASPKLLTAARKSPRAQPKS